MEENPIIVKDVEGEEGGKVIYRWRIRMKSKGDRKKNGIDIGFGR